jgi:hypothetical protein
VRVLDSQGGEAAGAIVDEQGNFRVNLTPGPYTVMVTPPVGMKTANSVSEGDPTARREMELASATVVAGTTTDVAATFIPWRRLGLNVGSPSTSTVRPGESVSWALGVASSGAPTSEVTLDLSVRTPPGARVALELSEFATVGRSIRSDDDDPQTAAGGACAPQVTTATGVTVRCTLRDVVAEGRSFTLRLVVDDVDAPGRIVPTVSVRASNGAAEYAEISGGSVSVSP